MVSKRKTHSGAHCGYGFVLFCIVQGMEYLEDNDLIHCDLAARNVLGETADILWTTRTGWVKSMYIVYAIGA